MISTLWFFLISCVLIAHFGVGKIIRHYDTPEEWQKATLRGVVVIVLILASTGVDIPTHTTPPIPGHSAPVIPSQSTPVFV